MNAALVSVLIVMIAAAPVGSQTSDERAVVPGARIGKWTLDMSVDEVLRINGAASVRPASVATLIPEAIWYSWDGHGFAVGTHDRKTIDYLAVYQGREYQTLRGIGYRALRKDVVSAYGSPTHEGDIFLLAQGRIVTVLVYNKIGLALFLQDDIVQVLLVFRAGQMQGLLESC